VLGNQTNGAAFVVDLLDWSYIPSLESRLKSGYCKGATSNPSNDAKYEEASNAPIDRRQQYHGLEDASLFLDLEALEGVGSS
jgi:hypothetical protein